MCSILHDVYINKIPAIVFDAITTANVLCSWWTLNSSGSPVLHSVYRFYFSPEYDWRGTVTHVEYAKSIAWKMTHADDDWTDTSFGFNLNPHAGGTLVEFYHRDWNSTNDHFRRSSYCWAMYLYLLKRYVELKEITPYSERNFA